VGLLLLNCALLHDFVVTFALIPMAGQAFGGNMLPTFQSNQ